MGLAGALACSFYDPTTGTVVQLNEIAAGSAFSLADRYERDLDGNRRQTGREFALEIATYASTGIEQLRSWAKNNTKVRFVLAGRQTNIIIYRDSTITVEQPFNFSPRGRNLTIITMSGEGKDLPVWQGQNILNGVVLAAGFDAGWGDDDSDNIPNGYQFGCDNPVFDYPSLTFESDTNGQSIYLPSSAIGSPTFTGVAEAFEFPISGVRLTFSQNVLQVSEQSNTNVLLIDSGSVVLEQVNESVGGYSAPKFVNMPLTTLPGTYYMRVRLYNRSFAGNLDTVEIENPALRTDGLYLYTE